MKPYKKPTSQNWYVKFQLDGREYKTSCFTSVRRDADAYARKWRSDIEEKMEAGDAEPVLVPTLRVLMDLDVARMRSEGLSESYVTRGVISNYKHLIAYFPDTDAVTSASLRDYVNYRRASGVRRQTIAKELTCLRRGLRLAELAGPKAWPKLTRDKKDPKLKSKTHDLAAWRGWLMGLNGEAWDIAVFALCTGLRREELYRVSPEDITTVAGGRQALTVKEKVDRPEPRQVVLGPLALSIVPRLPFLADHKKLHAKACAGNPTGNITLRDCRKAFSSAADRAGDARATDLAMGHTGIDMRYQAREYDKLEAIALAVEAWLVGPVGPSLVNTDKK